MAMVVTSLFPVPPPPPTGWVTLTVMVPVIMPLKPCMLAVIKMLLQTLPPAVISPVGVTVTQSVVALFQVT